jgi:hypothetical protein
VRASRRQNYSQQDERLRINIPATLPKQQPFPIMQTPGANNITGDFASWNLNIGNTGKKYTAGPDGTKQNYVVTTPP